MRLVDYSQRNAEVEDLEIADLLSKSDDLRKEVDAQAQRTGAATDPGALRIYGENATGHAQVALLNSAGPLFEYLLRVELEPEAISVTFQLLAFNVILPTFT